MSKNIWIETTSSSTIKKIRYYNGNVDIEFKEPNHFERYYNLSEADFNEIMNSSGIASYIKKKIKPKFKYFELDLASYEAKIKDLEEEKMSIVDFAKLIESMRRNKLPDAEIVFLAGLKSEKLREALVYVEDLPRLVLDDLCMDSNPEIKKRLVSRLDLSKDNLKSIKKNADSEIAAVIDSRLKST